MGSNRWPFTHNPKGWYRVAFSHELAAADVMPLKRFEKDLVLFRTESGDPRLLDAFCPHLGAHLGHGGTVDGDNLKCPFHAWTFDGTGQCTGIPYADRIPPKARIHAWEVVEQNGMIFAWINEEGGEPEWTVPEIPELASDEWTDPVHRWWRIRSHSIDMAENSVDAAHFKYLHGTSNVPDSVAEVNGPVLRVVSNTGMETPRGGVDGQIESNSWGFGLGTVRFTGLVETFLISTTTPVDAESVEIHFQFMVRKVGGADVTKGVGKAFIDEISRQLEQDIPIWENKVWVRPPVLAEGDGPIGVYRRWVKQFFPAGTFDGLQSGPLRAN